LLFLGRDGSIDRWKPERPIAKTFRLGQGIWLREEGGQLSELVGKELERRLEDVPKLVGLWRGPAGDLRMLTEEIGFLSLVDTEPVRLPAAAERELLAAKPYSSLHTDTGDVLVGCLDGSLYWYDAQLRLRHRWKVSRFPILNMAVDQEEGLWVVTEGEILRLDLRPQWRHLSPASGYGGSLSVGLSLPGLTLLGTSVGLYLDDGSDSLKLTALDGHEVRDLIAIEGEALVAGSAGIHHWRDGALDIIAADVNVLWLLRSRLDPDLVYAVEDAGLLILEREQGQWRETARVVDPAYRFNSLVEDPRILQLWAGQIDDDPFRLSLTDDGRQILAAERISEGLERPEGTDSNVVRLQDSILVGTVDGLKRWTGERFQPAGLPSLDRLLAPHHDELTIEECGPDLILAATSKVLLQRYQDEWSVLPLPGNRQGRGVVSMKCLADEGALIASWSGLSWYRPAPANAVTPIQTVVLEQALLEQFGASARPLQLTGPASALPPAANLSLSFAHPALAGGWTSQSRLWPVQEQWQDHGSFGERQLTTLSAGDYELQLRARDNSLRTTPVTTFAFTVNPPWHQLWWMQGLAVMLLLALTWAMARWRVHTLEQRNQQLEDTVNERTQSLWQRTAELESANQRLATLADQDGLTGVANRRRLDHDLEQGFDASVQGDRAFSLLMIDLDHFKQYNDSHGHQKGDERLRQTAQLLQQTLRWPHSLLARYGGEEFVAILPDAQLDDARAVAELLLEVNRTQTDPAAPQTVSIGLAERRSHGAATPEALLAMADRALYAAKNAGRDRVEIHAAGIPTRAQGASP
jgi:diguanylate cyclase (GGDEF)-like protein